jgi:hypothetical protein
MVVRRADMGKANNSASRKVKVRTVTKITVKMGMAKIPIAIKANSKNLRKITVQANFYLRPHATKPCRKRLYLPQSQRLATPTIAIQIIETAIKMLLAEPIAILIILVTTLETQTEAAAAVVKRFNQNTKIV